MLLLAESGLWAIVTLRSEQCVLRSSPKEDSSAGVDGARAGTVGQQGLLPRHADPKLWVMEMRAGEEREAVVKLMQQAVTMAAAGTPLAITSVFAQDHLRVRGGCWVQDKPHGTSNL